jgi:hypothetical protein
MYITFEDMRCGQNDKTETLKRADLRNIYTFYRIYRYSNFYQFMTVLYNFSLTN